MRKLLIAVLIGSLLVLALVTTALADNGPHGSFTATTDACASCHRAHSAKYGENALLIMDPESLCMGCHNGIGADTNVEDGVYNAAGEPGTPEGDDGGPLFGGGFDYAFMATAWSGKSSFDSSFNATSRPTTSHHNLGNPGTIWGSGLNNTSNGTMTLECTSCHDPHGTAGWNTAVTPAVRVASYRLLRWQPQGSNGFEPPQANVNWSGGAFPSNGQSTPVRGWLVPDNFPTLGTEWYTLGTANRFAVGDYNAGNANDAYNPTGHNYRPAAVATAFFCAQCHDRYFNNSSLRNNVDPSAYCNGGNPATIPPPTSSSDIHPLYPNDCKAGFNSRFPASPGSWQWGDVRSSGDITYAFRHSSGDIRASMDGVIAAGTGTSVSRSCVACHVAHGTAAQMTTLANNATLAAPSSVLLRMDNRSICLRCHASDVNFTVP